MKGERWEPGLKSLHALFPNDKSDKRLACVALWCTVVNACLTSEQISLSIITADSIQLLFFSPDKWCNNRREVSTHLFSTPQNKTQTSVLSLFNSAFGSSGSKTVSYTKQLNISSVQYIQQIRAEQLTEIIVEIIVPSIAVVIIFTFPILCC